MWSGKLNGWNKPMIEIEGPLKFDPEEYMFISTPAEEEKVS